MANREALRDLHSRLATRLQAARSGDVGASWLGVVSGGHNYLLPLAQAGEIFPWTPIAAVPYTHSWFNGVTNLRGGLFGVVDLSVFISDQWRSPLSDTERSDARFITFNPALETNGALLIDRLAGLRHLDAFATSSAPSDDAPAYFGSVYLESGGASWQEINLQILSRESHFLSISA
jgi:twitching motility protein PilI